MKRQAPLFLVFLCGLIMVIQFFVPHEYSDTLFQYANDFVIVIGILALPVGIYSLMKNTVNKAVRDGARMENLVVHTVKTSSGKAFPRCHNCQKTTAGSTVTSDPTPPN